MCLLGTLPLQLARNSSVSVQYTNCDEVSFTACKEVCWNSIACILGMFITDCSGVEIWKISRCVVVLYIARLLRWWWFMTAADRYALYTCQYRRTAAALCPVWVAQHKPVSVKVHIVPILSFLRIYPQLWGLAMSCVEAVAVFRCTLKFPSSGCTMWKEYVARYIYIYAMWIRVKLWGSLFLSGDGPFPLDITLPFPHLHHPYLCYGQRQQMTQWNWQPQLLVVSSRTTNGVLVMKWTWSKKSKESWQWTC